jgi:hypothetical protein
MMTMADVETAVCPFLNPGLADGPYALSTALYCIPRDFDACPVYERHASH